MLSTLLSPDEPVTQGTKEYGFAEIVLRLEYALNGVILTGERMESLIADQARLDAKHDEDTGEIEAEMVRVQENCHHHSRTEEPLKPGSGWSLITCDTCGKIFQPGEE